MGWIFNQPEKIVPTDEWDFYFCHVDDKPSSIMVDLGRRNAIPASGFPNLAFLRLYMQHPRPDGLSSDTEYEALSAIEKMLEAAWEKAGCVYVGRKTGDTVRDFYLYVADLAKAEKVSRSVLKSVPAYEFEFGGRPDESWSVYREFLFPDANAYRSILNRRVIGSLQEHGDDLSKVRAIDHRVYMKSPALAAKFQDRVQGLGFEVDGSGDSEGGEVWIDFSRAEDLKDIDAVTAELEMIAEEFGGSYDGWATAVIR